MTLRLARTLLIWSCVPSLAAAQATTRLATVTGVAYDSLSRRALSGAYVLAERTERAAATDTLGAFRLDSLAPGTYTLVLLHPVLDTLGLPAVTRQVTLHEGANDLVIAIPSLATLWQRVCGSQPEHADSGVVFGTIRSALNGRPVADAQVSADWSALALDAPKRVSEQRWRGASSSDANGTFALCGLPLASFVHLRASKDSASTGLVSVLMDARGVFHRDLLLGAPPSDSAYRRGMVTGEVRTADDQPVPDVTVSIEGADTVRSDLQGRFRVTNVPLGSRTLEARKIGFAPLLTVADVVAGDTSAIRMEMTRVTNLSEVRVLGSQVRAVRAMEFIDRKQHLVGHFLDSTAISRYHTMTSLFADVPTLRVRNGLLTMMSSRAGECIPAAFIDGVQEEPGELGYLHAENLAAMEVYTGMNIPVRFMPKRRDTCGVIVVWTKFAFP